MTHPALHKKLLKTLTRAQSNTNEFNILLHALLTPSEINDISLRLEILCRLKHGETQRSISETLGVGIATVTRGSRQLQESGGCLDSFLS